MSATGTVLGFDYGRRRIGVAVGQRVTGTATGLTTVAARDGRPDWDAIGALLAEWRPRALVVGVPRHADGSASEMTRAAERFARQLQGRYGLAVHTMDERLSSRAAEDRLRATRRRRAEPGAVDRLAAQVILQDWLDQAEGNAGETT